MKNKERKQKVIGEGVGGACDKERDGMSGEGEARYGERKEMEEN